ncbi:metallophosphoesterase family protein [bacterium]|nr:metallophosphoesterase family protein [bacterium]
MKIAVLSDIHANLQALEAVLKDIQEQGCEKVFCLGDLAMAGAQPDRTVNEVRKFNDWIVIQGNTDKYIAEYCDELYNSVKSVFPVMANALKDDYKIMSKDNIEYLDKLPEKKSLNVEGISILLVHGSPRRNNEDILPDMPIKQVEEIISGTSEDLIFCGHTHVPCGYQTRTKQTVVNVGSVGRPMTKDGRACYVIADFADGAFTIEHRLVDYDREKSAQLIKSRGFEGCDALADMILNPKDRHV